MYAYLMLRVWILPAVLALAPFPARAEVADSAANGFTSRILLQIQASPDAVYSRILQAGAWWDSAHTFSGDAKNLSIEEKAGGCFCEKLPNGGGARHMQVVNFVPGKTLVFSGGLGPLQSMAATGSLTIQLAPAEGGTRLQVTYAVSGYMAAGMNTLAAPVDGVLTQQFRRLKNLIEQGNPAPKAP